MRFRRHVGVLSLVLAITSTGPGGVASAGDRLENARQARADAVEPRLGRVTKQPMPRYVSLRSNRINVRRGPGLKYSKDWVFRRADLPVLVIDEYGDWRRIVDADDAGGWVYHSLLSRKRTVLVTAPGADLRARPRPDARVVAHAEQGAVARFVKCEGAWCKIDADGTDGWIMRDAIWGDENPREPAG